MKKNIILTLFLLMVTMSYAFRLDGISYNQRIDGSEGGYSEMTLRNDSLKKARYKIQVSGEISKYIEVYPKVITIEPKSSGTIKVFGKAPSTLPKKEYIFTMIFQPITIPTMVKSEKNQIAGSATIGIAPAIDMKAYIGEVDFNKALRFENIKIIEDKKHGVIVTGELSNTSYATIDFGIEAYGKNSYLYGAEFIGDVIGNTSRRKIRLNYPNIKRAEDLKKLVFYRVPVNEREIIKEIEVNTK